MSYSNRVYRQRNTHVYDNETNKEQAAFFSKSNDQAGAKGNKPSFFQARLSVGQPNDKYEQEADAVANSVVNHQNNNAPVIQQKKISSIQRYATPAEEEKFSTNDERMKHDKEIQEKPEVQANCTECEKEKKEKKGAVQTKADGSGGAASPQLSSKIEKSSGKGNTLPRNTLTEMSRSFGTDFSNVKIHADSEAVQMNRELGAQAFTHGNDIFFNSGKFNTDTADGKQLLAHELTHVVQQNNKIQKQEETNLLDNLSSLASNLFDNGCRKVTVTQCPGNSSNFTSLGYTSPMRLVNQGACTLFVHGLDANGRSISEQQADIPPGSEVFYIPPMNAVDTAVVCHSECSGSGILEHPFNCA